MTLSALFTDPTLSTVAAGAGLLGGCAGFVGTFAVVRRQSLQGDAVAHAALPGLAAAFLVGTRSPAGLLLGGAVAGWLALGVVSAIVRRTRTPYDAALGGTLAVFFGLGLVLISVVRNDPAAANHGLDRYLFGQAATIRTGDVGLIGMTAAAVLLLAAAFWKELTLLAFDPDYAAAVGVPVRRLDALLAGMTVAAVVVGIQAVGVVLMSTLLVAPAVAARQWSNRLAVVAAVAGLFGAVAGVGGVVASVELGDVPTGPTIALCATAFAVVSVAAPRRRGPA